MLFAAATIPPGQAVSICEVAAHPKRYLGKQVQVVGNLTDIEPHGVILTATGSDCALEVGAVAHGTAGDVLTVIHKAPHEDRVAIPMVAHVSIKGIIRSHRSTDFHGRPYNAFVLDEMVISYRTEGR